MPPKLDVEEEAKKSRIQEEEARLGQLANEKSRLEKELAILQVKNEKARKQYDEQLAEFQAKMKVDIDKVESQLAANRAKEERLNRTQSEVNQLRAALEADIAKQKDLLLRKEVELDSLLDDNRKLKADLVKRLDKEKK